MRVNGFYRFLIAVGIFSLAASGYAAEQLPDNLEWKTNDTAPVFASPNAKKGGTFRSDISSFPLTLRVVGPDSNGPFRSYILGNHMSLLDLHPNTQKPIPALATHWAFGDDQMTMYFKLNQQAQWSDGEPVTADDFIYTLKFMRSKHIVAPWYNNHYTKEIDKVIKYDDHTIAVVLPRIKPELWYHANLSPTPEHFYGEIPKDFVKKYNWKIVPNTGPYQIDKYKKGKSVTLKRKKDWWAKDLKYYKNRYNVDKIRLIVVRDQTTAFEYFKNNRIDAFSLLSSIYWHEKSKNMEAYDKGYVKKIWAYTDTRQSPSGLYLNQDKELFKDPKVRYAFAHAINVDKLIKVLLRNDYRRLASFNTGFGAYSNPNIRARTFDIGKVEALMTESGWQRGSDGIWSKGKMRFSAKVTYGSDVLTPRLVLLQEEAKKAGLELRLQRLDASTWERVVHEKKHDVVRLAFGTGFRPAYWQHFHSDNAHKPQTNNITNTDDPEMDKLIEAYRASTKADERIQYAHQIQQKVHDISAFIPMFYADYTRFAYWRWWQFPEVPATKSTSPFSVLQAGTFWLDPDLRDETKAAMKSGKTFKPETVIDTTYRVEH